MRAALDGDPLVNRTSVVSNSKGGVTVRIDMLPCPAGAGAACRTNRGRRAGALATLLYLAEQGRSDEGPFRVRAEVRLNGGIALRGRAPSTAADAVDLLKGALAGNQYFSRVSCTSCQASASRSLAGRQAAGSRRGVVPGAGRPAPALLLMRSPATSMPICMPTGRARLRAGAVALTTIPILQVAPCRCGTAPCRP